MHPRQVIDDMFAYEQPIVRCLRVDFVACYLNVSRFGLASHFFEGNKMRLLLDIYEALQGAYNDAGIRRWFFRKRRDLGGKSPHQVFRAEWRVDGRLPQKILALAKSLRDGNAT